MKIRYIQVWNKELWGFCSDTDMENTFKRIESLEKQVADLHELLTK